MFEAKYRRKNLLKLNYYRYGWVPEMSKLATEIQEKYKWIPKISITFMEILHGALRSRNKNALFFIRSGDSLEGIPS